MKYVYLILGVIAGVTGGYYSKRWAMGHSRDALWIASAAYIATLPPWFLILRNGRDLARMGMLWTLFDMIFVALCGLLVFHEHLSGRQWAGVATAVVAFSLLSG
jgi:multidrug transporter EmrE-like cation transporter